MSRVLKNDNKKNPQDFALWKFNNEYGWPSPWGQGFPGWHIECSAMASSLLGPMIDIHTGGIEHINIHHNNEITQSECANGSSPFSRFWVHRNHLKINENKISKSQGAVIFLSDLSEKGYSPLDLRYFFLQAHYSTPSNFTWDGLKGSSVARKRMETFVMSTKKQGKIIKQYQDKFIDAIHDNLNTPKALSVGWLMIEDDNFSIEDRITTLLSFDKVFGLKLDGGGDSLPVSFNSFPVVDINYMEKRKNARQEHDWKTSDQIRDLLREKGYLVLDLLDESVYQKDKQKLHM